MCVKSCRPSFRMAWTLCGGQLASRGRAECTRRFAVKTVLLREEDQAEAFQSMLEMITNRSIVDAQ